jgi:hypothetical protein
MGLYVVHIICAKMEGDMAVYGYARVSTDGQSLAAQLAELKAANCAKIFQEKISGARSDRKQLARLMVARLTLTTVASGARIRFYRKIRG